jgi:hypothetical protein
MALYEHIISPATVTVRVDSDVTVAEHSDKAEAVDCGLWYVLEISACRRPHRLNAEVGGHAVVERQASARCGSKSITMNKRTMAFTIRTLVVLAALTWIDRPMRKRRSR